jgi:hypothetical protein
VTVQSVVPTSTLTAPNDFTANLSPDSLMVYLSTRLNGLDDQIDAIFNHEQKQQKVQESLRKIQTALSTLDERKDHAGDVVDLPDRDASAPAHQEVIGPDGKVVGASPAERNIDEALDEIEKLDPNLAADMRAKLSSEGFILFVQDGKYKGAEVTATKQYIEGIAKDIESDSQMNMIQLQSLMSARQTAIQLSTNMIAALGESSKAIATNIGK